jgi:copper chaperone CopZ
MEKATFSLPTMWADHHVLAVRDALTGLPGVEQVSASALYKDVLVHYDPSSVHSDTLAKALVDAGYPLLDEPSLPAYPKRIEDSSDWFRFQDRITITDRRDLEASGDFRKY